MKGCPFEYQRHGSPREISSEDGERLYLNEGLVFAIFGMEMRRTVVSEVMKYIRTTIPKNSSYLGHFFFRFYPFRTHCARSRIGPRQSLRHQNASNPLA